MARRRCSFDGAAIDRSRKCLPRHAWQRYLVASMGPRSIDRGNVGDGTNTYCITRLRWGRDRSIAEISHGDWRLPSAWCFDGAAIDRSRKYAQRAQVPTRGSASMGPRSIDRGNVQGVNAAQTKSWLRWGRDRSIAE